MDTSLPASQYAKLASDIKHKQSGVSIEFTIDSFKRMINKVVCRKNHDQCERLHEHKPTTPIN